MSDSIIRGNIHGDSDAAAQAIRASTRTVKDKVGQTFDGNSLTTLAPYSVPLAAEPVPDQTVSGLPVGAWVGIGFGILIFVALALLFFIGHKRVTEYFVAIIAKRPGWHDNREKDRDLTFIEPEPSQCYNARGSHGGSTNTPKTSVPDFPFASVEVDADGRVSPRLPIMSKRGSSIGSTPSSALHRDA